VGRSVGGSSAANGQFFDRGTRYDYDAWAAVSSPEFDNDEHRWDWNGIYPFFKKVCGKYANELWIGEEIEKNVGNPVLMKLTLLFRA
jgi:choline dehydrogenase-like flavoprotein